MSWIVTSTGGHERHYDDLTDMLFDLISIQYANIPYDIVVLIDNLNKEHALEHLYDTIDAPLTEGIFTPGYYALAIAEFTDKLDDNFLVKRNLDELFYALANALADKVVDTIVENREYMLFDEYTITYLRW